MPLRQDEDVLDTWFSSALWPFSTLGWPDADAGARSASIPTTVLVTGFDIIFFWVARMIMMGLQFMGDVPFREVYMHGLVRDAEGQKMSKSKGNVIDPLDIIDGIELPALLAKRTTGLMQPHLAAGIEKATRQHYPEGIPAYGTDALRFTFASLATQSRDIRFDLAAWRATATSATSSGTRRASCCVTLRSRAMPRQTAGAAHRCGRVTRQPIAGSARAWAPRSRAVDAALRDYRFDFAASALYEFTWHEFCDWYLEIVKPVLQRSERPARARPRAARCCTVLETLLRLLHPLMPFITEEIWLRVAPLAGVAGESIMLAPWPRAADFPPTPPPKPSCSWVMQVVLGIRQIRGEMDIAPSRRAAAAAAACRARTDLQLLATAPGAAGAPGRARERARAGRRASRRRRPPPRWSAS